MLELVDHACEQMIIWSMTLSCSHDTLPVGFEMAESPFWLVLTLKLVILEEFSKIKKRSLIRRM